MYLWVPMYRLCQKLTRAEPTQTWQADVLASPRHCASVLAATLVLSRTLHTLYFLGSLIRHLDSAA